ACPGQMRSMPGSMRRTHGWLPGATMHSAAGHVLFTLLRYYANRCRSNPGRNGPLTAQGSTCAAGATVELHAALLHRFSAGGDGHGVHAVRAGAQGFHKTVEAIPIHHRPDAAPKACAKWTGSQGTSRPGRIEQRDRLGYLVGQFLDSASRRSLHQTGEAVQITVGQGIPRARDGSLAFFHELFEPCDQVAGGKWLITG